MHKVKNSNITHIFKQLFSVVNNNKKPKRLENSQLLRKT